MVNWYKIFLLKEEMCEWVTEVNEWMNKWKNKWVRYSVSEAMQCKLKILETLLQVQFPKKQTLRQTWKFIRNALWDQHLWGGGAMPGRKEGLNHKSFAIVASADPIPGWAFMPLHRLVIAQRLSSEKGHECGERFNWYRSEKDSVARGRLFLSWGWRI